MKMTKPNQISFDRRKFLIASGIVVTGGLSACTATSDTDGEKPAVGTKKEVLPSIGSPTIRVRIARIRNGEKVAIGDHRITKTIRGWKTTMQHTTSNSGEFQATLTSSLPFTVNNKTKLVSNNIVCVPRKEISTHAFDVVVHVPIEEYIPGVLAGELYAHWHHTTFEAQAIAARSYATSLHTKRINKSHFDVNDGPSSQMYLGDVSLEAAHRAARSTNGVVLTWDNVVIPAYYCACCGGTAATATDAISASLTHAIPPLQGRGGKDVCSALDVRVWSAKRSSRTERKRINACATTMNTPEFSTIRSIKSVEPTLFNAYGRPTHLAIYDRRNNAIEVSAKNVTRAFNASVIKLPEPTPTIWSSHLIAKKDGDTLTFHGAGLGHGVGLCQYGAQELAGKGESFESILQWYYPGATLSSLS